MSGAFVNHRIGAGLSTLDVAGPASWWGLPMPQVSRAPLQLALPVGGKAGACRPSEHAWAALAMSSSRSRLRALDLELWRR